MTAVLLRIRFTEYKITYGLIIIIKKVFKGSIPSLRQISHRDLSQ